jgi:hypothetical protein
LISLISFYDKKYLLFKKPCILVTYYCNLFTMKPSYSLNKVIASFAIIFSTINFQIYEQLILDSCLPSLWLVIYAKSQQRKVSFSIPKIIIFSTETYLRTNIGLILNIDFNQK